MKKIVIVASRRCQLKKQWQQEEWQKLHIEKVDILRSL